MKRFLLSILPLCSFHFFANASEVSEPVSTTTTSPAEITVVPEIEAATPTVVTTDVAAAVTSEQPVVTQSPIASAPVASAGVTKKSIFEKFKEFFNTTFQKKRTCQEAATAMLGTNSIIIDLSQTSDFSQNGDSVISVKYDEILKTKAFGTNSPNVSIDVSSTDISDEDFVTFISKWIPTVTKDKKILLINISGNSRISDESLNSIDSFQNIYSLNLAGTNITDGSVKKIIEIVSTKGVGSLGSLNFSDTKVSNAVLVELKTALENSVKSMIAQNPKAKYNINKDTIIYKNYKFNMDDKNSKRLPKNKVEQSVGFSNPASAPQAVTPDTQVDPVPLTDSLPADTEVPVISEPSNVAAAAPLANVTPDGDTSLNIPAPQEPSEPAPINEVLQQADQALQS